MRCGQSEVFSELGDRTHISRMLLNEPSCDTHRRTDLHLCSEVTSCLISFGKYACDEGGKIRRDQQDSSSQVQLLLIVACLFEELRIIDTVQRHGFRRPVLLPFRHLRQFRRQILRKAFRTE